MPRVRSGRAAREEPRAARSSTAWRCVDATVTLAVLDADPEGCPLSSRFSPFHWLLGSPFTLPQALTSAFPELARARWRRGGLALRIGGWLLGRSTVSGITLWRTIRLAPGVALDPELLLHEVRHVQQFEDDPLFPLRYVWGTVRHGYTANPYEADARAYAARRLAGTSHTV